MYRMMMRTMIPRCHCLIPSILFFLVHVIVFANATRTNTIQQQPQQQYQRRQLSFPSHAAGNCSSYEHVMDVNVAYYQSWSIWREPDCNPVSPEDLKVSENGYTHLAYSFASIDANFRLEPYESNFDIEVPLYEKFNALKETTTPNLKTLIAIGGWNFNNPGETEYRFSDTCSTSENRATFAQSCLEFCQQYNFDGIDIDWEFPGDLNHGGREEDKENLVLLVQAIRDVFDQAGKTDFVITIATPISPTRLDEGYELAALSKVVDFFHIMSYNIYTPNSDSTKIGANTDMPFIFKSVQYMLDSGVPPNKIVLGLAAYGRSYVLADPTCATRGCPYVEGGTGGCGGSTGFLPNFSIDQYIDGGNYRSWVFNPDSGTAELFVDENLFVSFDDEESYSLKYEYASQSCFRGTMWWSADMKTVERPSSSYALMVSVPLWQQSWLWIVTGITLIWGI